MSEYEKRITDLEKRLGYAEKLIEKMGHEIIAWTPRYKKRSAIDLLAAHLRIVRGEGDVL